MPGKPDYLDSIPGTHLKKTGHGSSLCYPSFNREIGRRQGPLRSQSRLCSIQKLQERPWLHKSQSSNLRIAFLFLIVKPVFGWQKTFKQLKLNLLNINLTLITTG